MSVGKLTLLVSILFLWTVTLKASPENVNQVLDSYHAVADALAYDRFEEVKALKKKKKVNYIKNSVYGNGDASKKIVKILEKTNLNMQLIQKQITY